MTEESQITTRRTFLIGAAHFAGGAWLVSIVSPANATPARMLAAIKKIVGQAPLRTGKVTIDIPPLVENGNTVPMVVTVETPMTATNYVKAIHVFNEKNPQPEVISVRLGPSAGKAAFSTRIKLADFAEDHGHRATKRRHVLVRQHRRHRDHRRLPRRGRAMTRVLINVPAKARRGDVVEIKTLI